MCLFKLDQYVFCQFRILVILFVKDILQFAYHDFVSPDGRIEV